MLAKSQAIMLAACWRMNARHVETALFELANDAPMAPARVLAREAQDQLDEIPLSSRASRPATVVGPTPSEHAAVASA